MRMLICLHGNPLQGQEFTKLLPLLSKNGFNPILHKRPIKGSKLEPLLQSISATAKVSGGGPFGLVAYGWGAYLALAYLNRFPENVTGVFLINPILYEPKPPVEESILWSLPVIRSLLIRLKKKKLSAAYLQQVFSPFQPMGEVKVELEPYLLQVPVWLGETAYKKLMWTNPIQLKKENLCKPVKLFLGEQDQVIQKESLKQLFSPEDISWVGEGSHALPWSHPELVANEIIAHFTPLMSPDQDK